MKFLTFLWVAAFILALVSGAYTFLQFDPNSFKFSLEHSLERLFHFPVRLGAIEIRWRIPLELHIKSLDVISPLSHQPLLHAPSAAARVRLWPLLYRHLVLDAFHLEGARVALVRSE